MPSEIDFSSLDRPDTGVDFSSLTAPAKGAAYSALGAQPDAVAKTIAQGKTLGMQPAQATLDPEITARQAQYKTMTDAIDNHHALRDWAAANPTDIKLANDDFSTMGKFLDAVGLYQPLAEVGRGFNSALDQHDYAVESAKYQAGFGDVYKLENYERKFARTVDPEGRVNEFTHWLGSMVGGLYNPVAAAGLGMVAGAGVGATAGGVSGGVGGAGIGALPGAAGGALVGGAIGATTGFVGDMFVTTSGSLYRRADLYRDTNGIPLTELQKQTLSISGATLGAGLGAMTGGLAANAVNRITTSIGTRLLSEKLLLNSITQTGAAIGRAGLSGAGINGGMQLGQELAFEIGKQLSGRDAATVFNDPIEREKLISGVLVAARDGALLFGGLRALPIAVHPVIDALYKNQAVIDSTKLNTVFAAAAESKLRERAPDVFEQFANHAVGDDLVNVSAEKLAEVRQADPKAFDYIEGIDQKIADARASGGDVSIPMDKYFAHTPPELHELVKDDIRSKSGLTVNDAKELEKNPPEYAQLGKAIEPNKVIISPEELQASRVNDVITPKEVRAEPQSLHEATSAIEQKTKALWLDPLFKTAEAAGMTKDMFARYSKHIQERQRMLTQSAFDAAYATIKALTSSAYKSLIVSRINELITKREGKATTELQDTRPDLNALEYFQNKNNPKMSKTAADALWGDGDFARRGSDAKPSTVLGKEFFEKDGLHPDDLTGFTGHSTGREMLHSLMDLQTRRQGSWDKLRQTEIAKMAQASVDATHGAPTKERIIQEALGHIMDIAQLKVLVDELHRDSKDPVTLEHVQDVARTMHDKLTATDALNVKEFERRIAKYGLEAERALLKEKPDEAFMAKQKQTLNYALLLRAKEFAKLAEKGQKLINKFSKERAPDSVPQAYTNQIHGLLSKLDFEIPRSAENLRDALGETSLEKFAADKLLEGKNIFIDPNLWWPKLPPIKYFTKPELEGFMNTLISLNHVGKLEKIIELGDKKEVHDTVVDGILETMNEFHPNGVAEKSRMRSARTVLEQPEKVSDWFDMRNPLGFWNTYVFRPMKAAEHKLIAIMDKFAAAFKEIAENKSLVDSFKEKIENTELLEQNRNPKLPTVNRPAKLTRGNLISIMLNMGTKGNRKVLEGGFNWDSEAINRLVYNTATKSDWAVVQKIWGMFAEHWPEVQRVTEAKTGVAVERVRGELIDTPDGVIRGGYYPLMADRSKTEIKANLDAVDWHMVQPFVSASAFKERTGKMYPLDLSLEQLPFKMRELAHALAFTEPVGVAKSIIGDARVRETMRAKFGKEYVERWDDWLNYAARDGANPDTTGMREWEKWSSFARQNAIVMLVGFRPSTSLIHGGAALSNSLGEIGIRNMAKAFSTQFKTEVNGKTIRQNALEESTELQNRGHSFDRDLSAMKDSALGQGKFMAARARFGEMATWLIKTGDFESAVPTYIAARDAALQAGHSAADAGYLGDKAVRNAHGSSGSTSLPSIARANDGWKWFTMFYGYFNHNFNQMYDKGMRGGEAYNFWKHGDSENAALAFKDFMKGFVYYLATPALIHELVRGQKHEDESDAWFWTKALTSQVAGGIPFVRDFTHTAFHGGTPSTPLSSVFTGVLDAAQDAYKIADDDDPSARWVKHLTAAPGWVLGLGTNSIADAAQGAYDWKNGNLAQDEVSWSRLFLDGNPHAKKVH